MDSQTELIDTLADLIEFPTVSGDFKVAGECFKYLEKKLTDCGLHTDLIVSNGFPSLFATSQNGIKKPKVILQAHMDVVPGSKELFSLREEDGRLFGRGIFDMKFAAACYLQIANSFKDDIEAYDFGIMFTSDEELGGSDGVGYLLDQGYGGQVCLLPDGGNDWHIEATCNGAWFVNLESVGKSAHGSRPWEGENAISKLVEGLEEIKNLFGEMKPGSSSVTISQINGGSAINQVPESAQAILDMRFSSQKDFESYKVAVQLIADNRGLKLTPINEAPCGSVDMKNPHVIDFMVLAEKIHGQPIEAKHSLGSSDARFFAAKNIPTIIIRPTGGGHHSDNEWIDKAELLKFYEVVKAYVKQAALV